MERDGEIRIPTKSVATLNPPPCPRPTPRFLFMYEHKHADCVQYAEALSGEVFLLPRLHFLLLFLAFTIINCNNYKMKL